METRRDMFRALPIDGAGVVGLTTHRDHRGSFTEVFREEWGGSVRPVQWNVVTSAANVLRGVHVHLVHGDYLIVSMGRATVGLADLREGSPTFAERCTVELHAGELGALVIPPGVAHCFYFHEPSMHVYAVSHYWNLADELGCMWNDPELGIDWPAAHPILSPRDAALPPLGALQGAVPPYRRS